MKTMLYTEIIEMPGADIGPENPLPDIRGVPDIHDMVTLDPSISAEEGKHFNYGRIKSVLPYRMQDGYTRQKKLRGFEAFVLENEHLKAVFFPQFGGRLWSLRDKTAGRDLVHRNPVFQPANLALRNAWFSGGVEWNIGMTGHTPYTLSPLFACETELDDGTPVLRMYEWERIRMVSYQLDAFLPEGSRFLYVRVRLRNTRETETPIYWWSNTAVNETPGTRVVAPADEAYVFDYGRVVKKAPVPVVDGVDRSYTTRVPGAIDIFFDIPEPRRKWEAALDENGEGLVQTSTDLLKGRKLFLWGANSGGKRWQEFLSQPGQAYLEIQAGLAHTQMEHLPMPANACRQWLEAYGYLAADPAAVHGEWGAAVEAVDERLEAVLPRSGMDELLKRVDKELDKTAALKRKGSGWGALEMERAGIKERFAGENAVFPASSLGADQQPWLELLRGKAFPCPDPCGYPAAYLTQPDWLPLLETSVASGKSRHWHALYHLGAMRCAAGDFDKAEKEFAQSDALVENAWAKYGLATLLLLRGETAEASAKLLEAARLLPILPIALECARGLLRAEDYRGFNAFYGSLDPETQKNGRMLAMRAQAAVMTGEFDAASEILRSRFEISDMREGEILLSDIWISLYTRKIAAEEGIDESEISRERVLQEHPVPPELDFRIWK